MSSSALDRFSPVTREWFTASFAAPTPAQEGAWDSIARGEHTLVVAPTGSGKTLAAFLWSLDRLAFPPAGPGPSPAGATPAGALGASRTAGAAADKTPGKTPGKAGKTEKAGKAERAGKAADAARRCKVVYVSPMKALAVDVERNLRAPLAGLRHTARRLGLPEPEITVAVRSGDTPAEERRRFAAKPSDILITTPESLFLLLTSQAREALRGVETVIVDEVHAVAGSKRGSHLALTLERLDALLDRPAQRVGLSATVRPVAEVAAFLGGSRPASVVQPPSSKRIEVEVVVPVEDMTELAPPPPGEVAGPAEHRRSIWPHVEEHLLDLIEAHRSTIVFANSRRLAERLCTRLNELHHERRHGEALPEGVPAELMAQAGAARGAVPEVVRAHHGSVSKEERAQIEEALKSGRLPAVVATSSLELGIDMGAVDLVVCVEAPPSVASGLQRIGRAGHQVGAVSKGVIFPKFRGDLVRTALVAERMSGGEIEEIRYPRNPLDVLAQQIVAMVAMDDWTVDDLEELVKRSATYSTLPRSALEATLDMLAGRYPSEEFAELRPRLVWDRVTGVLRGRPGAQRLAVTSGGTIPDRGLFGVFLVGEKASRVGELDEEMVYESRVGDVFVLGATSWRIEDITADRVLVSPAAGQPGKLPFWHGDTAGRPAELGRALGAFLRELAALDPAEAVARVRRAGLDDHAAANLVSYLAEQREATGHVPDDRTLLVERFRDELGDWRVVVHSPYGARVHAPWALAIARRLRERHGFDVQAIHSDDGIVLRVPDTYAEGGEAAPPSGIALFDPDEIERIVTEELGGSALFAARFRECAGRALLLPRRSPGRRTPLWQQRQRAAHLLSVAGDYPSFPVVLETMRECLQDVFDVPELVRLMRDLAAREVRLVEVETAAASPFAASLLFDYVGAFMYEGDAPLAERRAQALALDTSLLAELLGQADLRELLDPDVVVTAEMELGRFDRPPRDEEDLADLLRSHGPLPTSALVERGARPRWLASLEEARRAIRVRVAGEEQWAAIEDAARLRDALGTPLPVGVPGVFMEPVADPLGDLLSRHARTHGPFAASAAAARLGLGVAVVTDTLRRLAGAGRVVAGEFRPGGRGEEWCDAEVLRMLRRRSLARLRREVEAVPVEALAAFTPAWHGIAGHASPPSPDPYGPLPGTAQRLRGAAPADPWATGGEPGGPPRELAGASGHDAGRGPAGAWGGRAGSRAAAMDALVAAVEQLQGAAVPASALETLVLPARVPGYAPELLDELTASGDVIWAGQGALPGNDGWVALYFADTAPLLIPEPAGITMTPLHDQVLDALAGGGALFFRGLSERLGSLDDPALIAAVWDLVWAGRISGDTLAPLRALLGAGRTAHRAPTTRRRRAVLPSRSGPPTVAGRWWLLPSAEGEPARRAQAQTEVLLDRHGVLTRGAVAAERVAGGFSAVYPVLRAYEETGRCRRGYFVESLGGAQFALAGAVDRLRATATTLRERRTDSPDDAPWSARRPETSPRAVVLAAADPANPYGAALPWPDRGGDATHKPGRKAGALVVLVDGALVLYVERGGKTLLSFTDRHLQPAVDALALAVREGALGKLTVERADGAPITGSPLAHALEAAGFHPTPKGLRLRA
ncbi:Lhr family helicase [Bailinhaonella thermotolerans]|uniref:DEAD/DEAH box helicase n=1 Tax=Bailinhaonella thermotolerans TaxID=1070861 RepID=A0A3A4ALI9_9ACTN|nr:DEAD/DEAH box helicase [Bailinhaonella thermotolerans]RJL26530.1 DEAD/DEAH box helicase [Bailinhaonella thermotolerans]